MNDIVMYNRKNTWNNHNFSEVVAFKIFKNPVDFVLRSKRNNLL